MLLLGSADFFQNLLFEKILSGTLSVSNGLDSDQDRRPVDPDLGLKLFSTVISRYQKSPLAGKK